MIHIRYQNTIANFYNPFLQKADDCNTCLAVRIGGREGFVLFLNKVNTSPTCPKLDAADSNTASICSHCVGAKQSQ